MGKRRKTPKWKRFEDTIARYIDRQISRGNLGILPKRAMLVRPAKYLARDSGKHVRFEIAIELREPKNPNPIQVWIWDCKYLGRKVGVREARKFAHELSQLGLPVKGHLVTLVGYTESAVRIADNNGMAAWLFKTRVHNRVGLHGVDTPEEVSEIDCMPSKPGMDVVSLAQIVWREVFGKNPPPPPSRHLMELG